MKKASLYVYTILSFLLLSCEKNKQDFIPAKIFVNEDSAGNCGYLLIINNITYAPTNLPKHYQHYSGQPQENIVYIQYSELKDSLHCFDSIFVRVNRTYPFIEIKQLL